MYVFDAAIDARWRCRFCREHLLLQGAKATWQPQRNGSKDLACLLKKHYLYTFYIYIYVIIYMYVWIYIYLYIYVHIPGVSEHFDFHCLFCSARLKNVLSFWLVVLIQKGWVRLRAANKNIKTQSVLNICIYL